MKKLLSILLTIIMIIALCSCSNNTIAYNSDNSKIYYNGYTFLNLHNYNGKYQIDLKNEECIEIARVPYGFWYVLGAVTVVYGNNQEKPDYIANNRTTDLYLREDLCINHNTKLVLQHNGESFSFTIAEATTGEKVEYSLDEFQEYSTLLDFIVTIEQFPSISMHISIVKKDGIMFIQDCHDSDYYVITQDFFDSLNQAFNST